jgi:hypothetical protein
MLLLGHFSQYGTTSIRTKLYVAAGMGEIEETTISNIKNKNFSLVLKNLCHFGQNFSVQDEKV